MFVLSAIVIPMNELDTAPHSSVQAGHCSIDAHHLCNDGFRVSVNIH